MSSPESANLASRDEPSPMARSTGERATTPEFADVYREYFDFVWCHCRRLGIAEPEQDDLVQEVFVTIHCRLHTLERPDSLRSWIYGIVRRTASTYRRRKRTKEMYTLTFASDAELLYPASPTPEELAKESLEVRRLWALIDRLDPMKREIFVLAELDEMSVPEIAEALQIPLNTAYSRLRVARLELEQALHRDALRSSHRGHP